MMRRLWIIVAVAVLIAGCNMPGFRPGFPGSTGAEPTFSSGAEPATPVEATITAPASEPTVSAPTLGTGIIEPTISEPVPTGTVGQPGEATATPEPAGTPVVVEAPESYIVQKGTPAYMGNFVDSKAGCDWTGVAGQVFGEQGQALTEVVVEVSGDLNGQPVLALGMTGAAQALGPGGYSIKLGDKALETQGKLSIRVRDLSGTILSDSIPFDTYASCEKNLILINFVPDAAAAETGDWIMHLPFVTQP